MTLPRQPAQVRNHTMKAGTALPLLLLALLGNPVYAACDDGVAIKHAKAFWEHHRNFYYTDPAKIKELLTPDFFSVLSREAECNADGEVCAIDADPWTNAQDGDVVEPVTFRATSSSDSTVAVTMRYRLAMTDTRQEPQEVTLQLQKSGDQRCFLLDDFIPPGEGSLKKQLQQWQLQNDGGQQ